MCPPPVSVPSIQLVFHRMTKYHSWVLASSQRATIKRKKYNHSTTILVQTNSSFQTVEGRPSLVHEIIDPLSQYTTDETVVYDKLVQSKEHTMTKVCTITN